MFVAASSRCFPNLTIKESLSKLADLEYTAAELVVGKNPENHLILPESQKQFEDIVQFCRMSRRITPIAIYFDYEPEDADFLRSFECCAFMAKAAKIVQITVKSSELGTPFNAEVERLRQLTKIGNTHGLVIGVATETRRMSEDPDSLKSICKTVHDLSVTLDPSHYIYSHSKPKEYDHLLEYVSHVRLRDTTKEKLQVQIGQGIQEYGRLVIQLNKVNYRRALCVDLTPLPDIDQEAELRKMRLLLESLL
ncbi:MAG: sugar phosphate isomerase/epimerase [Planctomycetaceae bacterium]|nr:sugar phosphate isomerase/epimerase [Planctomycetaceae bacterium]